MNFLKLLLIVSVIMSCQDNSQILIKPEVFEFGSSMATTKERVTKVCEFVYEKLEEPIQLPTAKESQSQLDCLGFNYAGKKRKIDLIFADDALDIIWILTDEEEENLFIEQFKKLYGEPTHIKKDITFFLDAGVAVRNNPHEVLFISERQKKPYAEWLNSSN